MQNEKPASGGNRAAGYGDALNSFNHSPRTSENQDNAARRGAGLEASYRASTIKRNRRTGAQTAQLDQQIIAVLKEDRPQSVRHVFYRMTDPRLPEPVEKKATGDTGTSNPVASPCGDPGACHMRGSRTCPGAVIS